MNAARLQLLGPVELVIDGVGHSLGGARQSALVAALAVAAGRVVPTSTVVDQVWGSAAPRTVVKSMSTLLSRVRPMLEPHGFEITFSDAGYRLDGPPDGVDAHAFRDCVGRSRVAELSNDVDGAVRELRAALDCWSGPALAGMDAPFAAQARAVLTLERDTAIADLARLHLRAGDPDTAVDLLRELADSAPLREDRQAELMHALTQAGRADEALAVYESVDTRLGDQLGLEPSESLRAARSEAAGPDEGQIVGRSDELDQLETALREAVQRQMQLVLITGEPGSGKSHLVRAFMDRVSRRGFPALVGRCEPTATLPMHPFLQIFEQVAALGLIEGLDDPHSYPHLRSILTDDRPDPVGEAGGLRRRAIFNESATVVGRLTAQSPLIVVIEDFHNADAFSLAVLHAMAYEGEELPVIMVLTAREAELLQGGAAELAINEMALRRPLRRIRLAPLGPAHVAALVAQDHPEVAGDPALLQLVQDGAGGNALYASLLAKHIADHSDPAAPLPADIVELIQARLLAVPDRGRDLLLAASVLGQEFTLDEAGALLTDDQRELQLRTFEARRSGLLEVLPGGSRHRFVHGIVQRVAYELAPDALRALLHHRAAVVRERASVGDLEVLHHLLFARPFVTDAEVADRVLSSARRSIEHGMFETAIRIIGAADELDVDEARRVETVLLGGVAQVAGGDASGLATLDEGIAAARELDRWDLVAEGLIGRSRVGRAPTVVEADWYAHQLTDALDHGTFDDQRRAHLLGLCAEAWLNADSARAEAVLVEAETLTERLDAGARRRVVRLRALQIAAIGGPAVDVAALVAPLVEEALAADDMVGAVLAAQTHQGARLRLGEFKACLADMDRFLGLAAAAGRHDIAYQLRAQRVALSLLTDSMPTAQRQLDGLVADHTGAIIALSSVTWVLQHWTIERERLGLGPWEGQLRRIVEESIRPGFGMLLAPSLLELGRVDEARSIVAEAFSQVVGRRRDWSTTTALAVATDLAVDLGVEVDVEGARELLEPAAGEVVVLGGWMTAVGRVDRYLGRLDVLAGNLDGAIAHFDTARRLDRDAGSGLWAAWAARDEAVARRKRGAPGDVEAALPLLDGALRAAKRHGSTRLVRSIQAEF